MTPASNSKRKPTAPPELVTADAGSTPVRAGGQTPSIAQNLRKAREAQDVGLRELSRRVGVSASMISQIERGNVMPSVATLYSIVSELQISLDDLFFSDDDRQSGGSSHVRENSGPVLHSADRNTLVLDSGVRWELLTAEPDPNVDFIFASYPVGSESTAPDQLQRHGGKEYGLIVFGRLGVTVGFETWEMGAGDSISFDSTQPHRLFSVGSEETQVVWVVVGRRGDTRTPGDQ
jgi:transcriptional regulator with XRE-family HTH domain